MIDSRTDLPLVATLPSELTPVEVFQRLAHLPHVVFFDSASQDDTIGRYSFVAVDPFQWLTSADAADPLAKLEEAWRAFPSKTAPGLPPFQGGVAGLLGYDLARTLENIPAAAIEDFPVPTLAVGLYDVVFAFDHTKKQAWIISQGFPEIDPLARKERAEKRLYQAQQWLAETPKSVNSAFTAKTPAETSVQDIAEQFDVGLGEVTSNLPADAYRRMIERAIEYIHAGDIFQVNLAQRLLTPARTDSLGLYLQLRQKKTQPPMPGISIWATGRFVAPRPSVF